MTTGDGDARGIARTADSLRCRLTMALRPVAGDDAGLEARMITEAATGLDRAALRLQGATAVRPAQLMVAETMLARRLAREPLSQILGSRGSGRSTSTSPPMCSPPSRHRDPDRRDAGLRRCRRSRTRLSVAGAGSGHRIGLPAGGAAVGTA
ncbi:hypothetical protein ACFQ4K_10470 [Tistrella bauzanensis]